MRRSKETLPALGLAVVLVFAGLTTTMNTAGAAASDRSAGSVVDDAVITSKIKAELIKDPTTKAADINVDTRNGVVQLSGFVDSDAARKRAELIAGSVEGVGLVRNNLQLQDGQRTASRVVDDAAISAKVKSALIANPLTKAHQIKVDTDNGTVELSGFVDSADAKMEAARVAQGVTGVTSVENKLELKQ